MSEFVGVETALGNEIVVRIRDIKCIKTSQPEGNHQWQIYFDSSFAEIDRYLNIENPIEITESSYNEIARKLLNN